MRCQKKEDIMETNYAAKGEEYYKVVSEKKPEELKKYMHSDVEFYGPMGHLKGKDAIVDATTKFMNVFKSLKIRAKFGTADQAMIVYDSDIPGISNKFPGASLLTFRDGLIVKIELFHDTSQFKEMQQTR